MTGYRTLLFSLLISVVGVLQAADWINIIPQNQTWSGIAMVAVGAIIAALRSVTTTPIGESK